MDDPTYEKRRALGLALAFYREARLRHADDAQMLRAALSLVIELSETAGVDIEQVVAELRKTRARERTRRAPTIRCRLPVE